MKEAEKSQQPSGSLHKESNKALLTIDLSALALELKGEESWKKSERGSRTIFKSETMRILLNVMQAGSEIKPHQAPGPISVQVIEGRIRFNTEAEVVVLAEGQLLTLQEHVCHSVEALEEATFLLTVSPLASKA
jgi:quercetin dioxygenase-like cupin family protein